MKKLNKFLAILLTVVLCVSTITGCGAVLSGEDGDKGLVDSLLGILDSASGSLGGNSGDSSLGGMDSLTSLFGTIMGDDWYGWGDAGSNEGWGWDSNASYGTGSAGTGSAGANFSNVDSVEAGEGKATVLIYMIGSNLETEGGCATTDIMEMIDSNIGDNVNVIIQAGGAKKWQNNIIKASNLGTYKVENGGLSTVRTSDKTSMVETSTLVDFIKWGVSNYPADSYSLIFWNHGGGTLAGFGMDELFKGDLTVGDIASAIKSSGAHFKFVGFDACLMGTVEVAYAMSPYADYLVASEEEEPGAGWYYTNWLKALSKNPSLDMSVLGKMIVDDFVASNNRRGDNVTLSVVDLSKINELYSALIDVCSQCNKSLMSGEAKTISSARSKAKSFGSSNYDQIDIIDFCQRSGVTGANELINVVNDSIVYHKTNMSNTNGLAMYFPYKLPSYYSMMSKMMKSFGMDDAKYTGFFKNFLSVISGHSSSSRSMSPMSVATGYEEETTDYSSEEWYSEEAVDVAAKLDTLELNEYGELVAELIDDNYGIHLSEEEYETIGFISTVAYLDDGEGYIDLGNDDIYEFNDEYSDGSVDLLITFDNNWVAINGQIVPYYAVEASELLNGQSYSEGNVYAILTDGETGEEKNIVIDIIWNNETGDASVIGYKNDVEEGSQAARKLFKFKKGDKIQALCDYYTYDGEYEDEYLFGDEIVVDGELQVSYEDLGECDIEAGLYIKDIYNQEYWTELIRFSD